MQAARLHEYTDEMSTALQIDDIERPTVSASNGVVVEVQGAGWCQTDNHIIEGMWAEYVDQPLPMTLGHENAGTVVETGDEVQLVEEGDPVICHPVQTCGICRPCRQGEDMYCENSKFNGLTTDGGFAEYLSTNERAVIPLPDGVDPIDIAPHADAGITAYHAAKKAVHELNPGDTAVVIGIGGLGHIGLQCVDAMSAPDIVAVDVKDEALDLATALGANHTINPTTDDVVAEIDALTDGTGAAQVLDFVGADETTGYAPDIVAAGGDHHIIGYGGHVHEPSQALVNGEFSFRGTLVGQYTELQELVALVERGDVELRTTRYGLDEVNTVAEHLEHGEIEGRAVITP
ncbi:alcohol dehydrogenase catalytic domain-containing protein [Haloferax sp. MBLA0076]|uniref:Alcohol dehydrogenase catalytic domain-containing protein n=1 Tax=Haloferax litoreum TaxID=2666140 RepID=A0A6A8GER7_9EURY|nr:MULTISPECIES: NAD(P)-dependent alcohol dehydrogenase [Haloferax]KAB1193102.1 NAD(P)-dependent alcohol dehydrogenase [Haloferax sp. CBA1148]MRX21595.1 alcohol dehydrogenase catalytic domain-containing protein [Haloferax litoreum]